MKKEIIALLLRFDRVNYHRLYLFLSFDKRVEPFTCYCSSVDVAITLKNKEYPRFIYEMLCEHYITPWNISASLLMSILNGDSESIRG